MASYKKNLKEVEEHLKENEEIKYSVFGVFMSKKIRNRGATHGIFVATNSRIVFFSKSHYYGYELESFPFETISSIEMTKKIIGHKIKLFSSGNSVSLKWINKGDVQQFTEYVNSMIGKKQSDNSTVEIPEQIKKLAELKDQGILTDEEFSEKKKELLGKM